MTTLFPGCALWNTPLPSQLGIDRPLGVPDSPGPALPDTLPAPPQYPKPKPPQVDPAKPLPKGEHLLPSEAEITLIPKPVANSDAVLNLPDVLLSVTTRFPLLLAIQQEQAIAAGQRLAAEGAFDLNLRARGTNQEGSFGNSRVEFGADQATPYWGTTVFAGYRLGYGDFPIYSGGGKTADGGEFRAGFTVPLLRDGPIDRRRAALRQAQIVENLADPTIRRARLDFLLGATRAYYAWVAAGERYAVFTALFNLANDRQAGLETQNKLGAETEYAVVQNRVLIASRQGDLVGARRRLEAAAFDLSLFLRDENGNAVTPTATRLPREFTTGVLPTLDASNLTDDTQAALAARPELERFRFLKERITVDLNLATNQIYPNVVFGASASQDVGNSKKTFIGTGPFATDRANAEVFLAGDVPWQRREALGRAREAQARLAQLIGQEQFEKDRIAAQVQDAASNFVRVVEGLAAARQEAEVALRVASLERERFRAGASNLLNVNLQEVAAAAAATKVINAVADAYRAYAEYLVTLGQEPK
ncbi:MAG: TolC family protein [Gemmataceae bacterium]